MSRQSDTELVRATIVDVKRRIADSFLEQIADLEREHVSPEVVLAKVREALADMRDSSVAIWCQTEYTRGKAN